MVQPLNDPSKPTSLSTRICKRAYSLSFGSLRQVFLCYLARMAYRVTTFRIGGWLLPAAVDFVKAKQRNAQFAGNPRHDPVKAGQATTDDTVGHAKKIS